MNFEEYCGSKKINPALFRQNEPEKFTEWQQMYEQTGPVSFTQQKLFHINNIRRKYKMLAAEESPVEKPAPAQSPAPASASPKPSFKPKMK